MKKEHIKYLAAGIIFWGILIGLFVKLVFVDDAFPIHVLVIAYVSCTALIVLTAQFYIGGFPRMSPKSCFFIPVAGWIFLGIWGIIEGYFLGVSFSLFEFISRF